MWTANAATVSPSSDSHNKLLHLSVANLTSNLHRAQEASERFAQLRDLFANVPNAIVHAALPACTPLRDEGAANHMRLGVRHRDEGLEIFVHGGNCIEARQAYDASRALARRHQLAPDRTFYLTQSPQAIAAGVFHNDVIATSHENLLVYHEDAFADGDTTIGQIEENFRRTFDQPLIVRKVLRSELSLADAVDSYLFNSQIVSIQSSRADRNGPMVLLAPRQCRDLPAAEKIIHRWIDDPSVPIESVEFVALDQSMANGGGPACVRLRVSLTESQYRQLPTACLLNEESYSKLQNWVERCYPERLTMSDLPRADLAEHVLAAIQAAPF